MENKSDDLNHDNEESKYLPSDTDKNKILEIFNQLEFFELHKEISGTSEIGRLDLDKDQINKLIDKISESEKNAFELNNKKIDTFKEIELKRLDTSVINQKTVRLLLIGGLLVIIPLITTLILLFKDNFFIPWLTFLTGIIGGIGLSKSITGLLKPSNPKNSILDEEDH